MRPKNTEKEEAIRNIALQLIAEQGLENLSMQQLAKAANISPRTIYIKYENKEDLLVKLFIEVVLGAYEKAALEGFSEDIGFAEGIRKIWLNTFNYFKKNRHAFVLMEYGKSSPLLNKAFREKNIKEGSSFGAVHRFLDRKAKAGEIAVYPQKVYRSLLFAPLLDLVHEYFEHREKGRQIITEQQLLTCCATVIKGIQQ